jgi:hypothetical protein
MTDGDVNINGMTLRTNDGGSNGNVGIGTTTPGQKLDVLGVSRTYTLHIMAPSTQRSFAQLFNSCNSGVFSVIGSATNSDNWMNGTSIYDTVIANYASNAGVMIGSAWPLLSTGATGALGLYVNESNNVGIGTNAPEYKLDVVGVTQTSHLNLNGQPIPSSPYAFINIEETADSSRVLMSVLGEKYKAISAYGIPMNTSDDTLLMDAFMIRSYGKRMYLAVQNVATASVVPHITLIGNPINTNFVGINNIDPETIFHVKGGEISTSDSFHSYRMVQTFGANTRGAFWRNDGQSFYLMGTSNNDPWGNMTGYRPFQFNMATGHIVLGGGGLTVPPAMYIEDQLIGGYVGFGMTAPLYRIHMLEDSAFKAGTGTWTFASDERLKEDIVAADIDICYANVKNIPLKFYKWRDDVYTEAQVPDRHKLGWIAQDVESVFPKAVSVKSMHGFEDCRNLNTDQIYATMYGAIQKLQQLVESQSATIADYETVLARQANTITKQASAIAEQKLALSSLKDQSSDIDALKTVVSDQTQKMAMMADSVSNMMKIVSQLMNTQSPVV